jgi:hypothetical protein
VNNIHLQSTHDVVNQLRLVIWLVCIVVSHPLHQPQSNVPMNLFLHKNHFFSTVWLDAPTKCAIVSWFRKLLLPKLWLVAFSAVQHCAAEGRHAAASQSPVLAIVSGGIASISPNQLVKTT